MPHLASLMMIMILQKNLAFRYTHRPQDLQSMCLAEFAAIFITNYMYQQMIMRTVHLSMCGVILYIPPTQESRSCFLCVKVMKPELSHGCRGGRARLRWGMIADRISKAQPVIRLALLVSKLSYTC